MIAVTLLPAALVFLILLLNDKELMGKYNNTLAPEHHQLRDRFWNYHLVHALRGERDLSPMVQITFTGSGPDADHFSKQAGHEQNQRIL